jgi:feruloyl esterase
MHSYLSPFADKQPCKYLAVAAAALMLLAAPAFSQQGKPKASCESLAKLALPNTTITMAETVAAGTFKFPARNTPPALQPVPAPQGAPGAPAALPGPGAPGGPSGPGTPDTSKWPAFCRIAATLAPSSDSDIKIEVWLPADNWNGKFIAAGNGGWAGSISYQGMAQMLVAGYATTSTDTGHTGNSGAFIIGHPEKFIDYTWRADHEMTLKAKEIIKAFYGTGPKFSYWIGCSLGGQEALIEAAKFPEDYNGIVAGAPLNPIVMFNADQMWTAWLINKNPEKLIPGPKWTMIHDAVMKKCGAPVDLKLGYLTDPNHCDFQPSSLACKGADAADCLTAPQVEFLTQYYEGPKNPRTGAHIYHGQPKGAELDMVRGGGVNPAGVAVDMYKYAVFQDPNWDWKTLDYDKDIDKADKVVDPLFRAYPNQIAEYLKKGGKLLIHMGGTESFDGSDIIDLVNDAAKQAGPKYKDSIKLFEMPGMNHCGGGLGCDQFDKIGTIDSWVTEGKTPERIVASKLANGQPVRTRPICAWPLVSRYKGSGSEDDAASYVCAK